MRSCKLKNQRLFLHFPFHCASGPTALCCEEGQDASKRQSVDCSASFLENTISFFL